MTPTTESHAPHGTLVKARVSLFTLVKARVSLFAASSSDARCCVPVPPPHTCATGALFAELLTELNARVADVSPGTQRLLTQAMWSAAAEGGGPAVPFAIDTSSWRISARDAAGVRQQLQQQLVECGAPVAEILRLFDIDAGDEQMIDDMEFYNALRDHFGYRGTPSVITKVFSHGTPTPCTHTSTLPTALTPSHSFSLALHTPCRVGLQVDRYRQLWQDWL